MTDDVILAGIVGTIRLHIGQIVGEVGEYEFLAVAENKRLISDQFKEVLNGNAVWGWRILEKRSGHIALSSEATGAIGNLATRNLGLLLEMLDASKNASAMMLLSPRIRRESDLPVGLSWLRSNCSPELAALALVRCIEVVCAFPASSGCMDGAIRPWSAGLRLVGDALAFRPAAEEVHLWWQIVADAPGIEGLSKDSGFSNELYGEAAKRLSRHALDVFLPSPQELKKYQERNHSIAAIIPWVALNLSVELGTPALEAFYRDVERRFWGESHELPQADRGVEFLYIEAAGCAMLLEATWGITPGWRATILSKLQGRSTCWDQDGTPASAERLAFVVAAACVACLMMKDIAARKPILDDVCCLVDAYFANWMWAMGTPCTIRKYLPRFLTQVYALLPLDGATRVLKMAAAIRDVSMVEEILQIARPIMSDKQNEELANLVAELKAYENDLNPAVAKGKD